MVRWHFSSIKSKSVQLCEFQMIDHVALIIHLFFLIILVVSIHFVQFLFCEDLCGQILHFFLRWHLLDSLNYIHIYLILNLKYWNITFTYKSLFQGQQLFHCWRHSAVFNREKRWNLCLCKLYSKVLFPWFLLESHYFVVG